MSIIRQVTWDEFTNLIGTEQFTSYTEKGQSIVLFLTDWSFPSRLALKRIKKLYFDKKKCGIVDVDLVDSIELINRYEIKSVPYCMVLKEGEITQTVVGYHIQQLLDIFAPLVTEYHNARPPVEQNCPSGHPLSIVKELPPIIYVEGYVYCDRCRKIQQCTETKPVGHCEQCEYDLCNQCLKTPLE